MNNEKLEAGLASDLNRELDTTSDEHTKKWRCKDCGGSENYDHRGCMKNSEIEQMARTHEAFYIVSAEHLSRATFLTLLKKANDKLSA